MLTQNNPKIEQHKIDIEKRIADLENKLRQPLHYNQLINFNKSSHILDKIDRVERLDREQPYKRSYIQKEQYIQPREVSALRERQVNARDVRNIRDTRDLKNMRDEKDLTDIRDMRETRDFRELRQKQFRESRYKYEQLPLKLSQTELLYDNKRQNSSSFVQPIQLQRSRKRQRSPQDQFLNAYNDLTNLSKTKQIINHPNYRQERSISVKEAPKDGQLYNMMTMILNNQKNLQKQIGLLRSEWKREQGMRNLNQISNVGSQDRTPYGKLKVEQAKNSQVVSFQDQDFREKENSGDNVDVFEIRNINNVEKERVSFKDQHKKKEHSKLKQKSREMYKEMQRNIIESKEKNKKDNNPRFTETFGVQYSNQQSSEEQAKNVEEKVPKSILKQKNTSSNTKRTDKYQKSNPQQAVQAQQKLYNLIKNQKSRTERYIVTQQSKNEFWKQLQLRIRASEQEYQQTMHRNNRYEQDHLINTNELQKKMKEDVIAKVYAQCNHCIYK